MASRTYITILVLCAPIFAQSSRVKARDLYFSQEEQQERHLGLRYNLLQVNPTSREAKPVDPDANFASGDCFALEFVPNQAGSLYIFNRASSGDLRLLLPSPEMPDEASRVQSERTIRVPQEYCFSLSGPPGVETLIVAVTERPEDLKDLRAGATASITQWEQQQIAGRDIVIEKLDAPQSANERAHAVYAVLTTAAATPSRLVMEVKIRHE